MVVLSGHAIVILSDKDNLADVALNLMAFLNMKAVVNVPHVEMVQKKL